METVAEEPFADVDDAHVLSFLVQVFLFCIFVLCPVIEELVVDFVDTGEVFDHLHVDVLELLLGVFLTQSHFLVLFPFLFEAVKSVVLFVLVKLFYNL